MIKLNIYYEAIRPSNLLFENKTCLETDPTMQHHVVYLYTCNRAGCRSTSYVGYTTCTRYVNASEHTLETVWL